MKRLKLAVGFLTVFPIHIQETYLSGDMGRAAGWFPYIGALLGLIVATTNYGLTKVFPPLLAAACSTAIWIAITGGLHLDGLADSCDGLLNASNRERRLEIMKDPRLGTFGGLGLILAVLLKFVCLYSLPVNYTWIVLPLAAGTSRWLLLWAGRQPLARPGGMGADFAAGLNTKAFFQGGIFIAFLIILAVYQTGWIALAAIAIAHVLAWGIFTIVKKRLGGVTGDIYGMLVELSELVILLIFCIKIGGVL